MKYKIEVLTFEDIPNFKFEIQLVYKTNEGFELTTDKVDLDLTNNPKQFIYSLMLDFFDDLDCILLIDSEFKKALYS